MSFKSKKTAEREGPSDMGATAILEIETEKDKDAQAIFERTLKINKVGKYRNILWRLILQLYNMSSILLISV